MSITVTTSILGAYDNLHAPAVPGDARYICYTDEPRESHGWEIQPAALPYDSASRNSRIPKILSHLHCDSEFSIWVDGCMTTKADPRQIVSDLLGSADLAVFVHPRRNAYSEAEFCRREKKSLGFPDDLLDRVDAQLAAYRAEGFPGAPFVCGGLIVRRENAAVRAFNELWWSEYLRWQKRDQFSLAYALWKTGINMNVIPDDVLGNKWFGFHFHGWKPDLEYAEEQRRMETRRRRLKDLCS